MLFQHTAARRRLAHIKRYADKFKQFQHTAARRRLGLTPEQTYTKMQFQHTAARRRLGGMTALSFHNGNVSTHSRPKAAGFHFHHLIH